MADSHHLTTLLRGCQLQPAGQRWHSKYDGNISAVSATTVKDGTSATNGYRFLYDSASHLKEATYVGGGDWCSTTYSYDANGNMTNLTRKGPDAAGAPSYWDDLTMTYDGNKLLKVTDEAPTLNTYNSMQFVDGVNTDNEFSYDQNGNLTKDSNRNISSISYNLLNLPRKITVGNGYEKITYDINGVKLHTYTMPRTYAPDPVDTLPGPIGPAPLLHRLSIGNGFQLHATKDYCNGIVYSGNSVERVLVDGGYITFSNNVPVYHYYLKDHLGSNRMVVSTTGDIEQINTYYPFGASRKDSENNGQTQTYKYTGKELEGGNQLYWYDYGARWYDAVLGRFTTMDPLCEEDYSVSPYVYCANNPVNSIDPTGLDYWSTNDPYEINRFFQSWHNGSEIDYSGWNHTSDADFLANLSYNDKTGNYLYSYGALENGEAVCYGQIFPSAKKSFSYNANNIVDNLGTSLQQNAGNSTIGSNGHFYWHSGMERGFYGNQYVSTMSLAKFGRGITKVTGPIGIALSTAEIYKGYQQDKGIGYNTIHATAGVGGGYLGGALGLYGFTELGAIIGAPFGPGGMIVAGFIGATLGSIVGSYCATQITDRCYGY